MYQYALEGAIILKIPADMCRVQEPGYILRTCRHQYRIKMSECFSFALYCCTYFSGGLPSKETKQRRGFVASTMALTANWPSRDSEGGLYCCCCPAVGPLALILHLTHSGVTVCIALPVERARFSREAGGILRQLQEDLCVTASPSSDWMQQHCLSKSRLNQLH